MLDTPGPGLLSSIILVGDDDDHDDNDDAGVDDDDTLGPGLQSWIIQVGFELTICGALSRITNSEHQTDPFIVM